ncbi:leucine-rich repeats and immunoglobulin-like domains protein 2 isoform X1 [Limulus polyphemus]|uniref:Leucine-rich repeats and immunoglobulin-like domains protein 2 isoform X1 n=1 Tax=Limulus polyphemus TaxID=6850 RepID=A0ABM1B2C5_LIMPO|nr:leucine-rich repeats and immunoglobulin-like domains protein 2 isoform X1 [Limulus polyphemus]
MTQMWIILPLQLPVHRNGFESRRMAMNRLRGSPCIIVLLFYFTCLWTDVVAMCPVKCNCDDENLRVECEFANLDVVPITLNPELRELVLKNNHIKSIMASFGVYHNLEYLDVSHNQLITIGKNNFQKQSHLNYLLLSRNMISSIQNETFLGLEKLTVLHMNENFLQEIPPNVFSILPSLENLDLSQNRIFFISDAAFVGLNSLRVLSLRDNKITSIPVLAFHNLPTLLKLDIGLNSLRKVPEEGFSSLRQLEELSLDGCGIETIELGAFRWLNSLLVLRLQDNDLDEIPTTTLFDVRRLEEINIGQNNFFELKPLSFKRLKYLRVIEISGGRKFLRIQNGAFADNNNLQKLVLNHNKIFKEIDLQTFDNLPNLKMLSLRGNAFTTFHYDLLPWDELDVFDVRDNPLICDCELKWLCNLLKKNNFTSVSPNDDLTEVRCASPPAMENALLTQVTEEDLGCFLENRRRKIIIGVVVAAVLTVSALVLLGIRYRENISRAFKKKWISRRKDPQYQKTTCVEEEHNILHAAAQQSLKMAPVTEL